MVAIAAISAVLLVAALVILAARCRPAGSGGEAARLGAKGRLLTEHERAFADRLELALNGRYRITPKVPLARVVEAGQTPRPAARAELRKRLDAICLDFVLTEVRSWEVLAVIMLEARGAHAAASRSDREFLESALRSANIHLLRLSAGNGHSASFLAAQIESILSKDFIETLTFVSPEDGDTVV